MSTQHVTAHHSHSGNDVLINDDFAFPKPSTIQHVKTSTTPSQVGFARGDTTWSCQIEHINAIVSWGWVELRPGIIMLSDPNSVASNVRFLQSPGSPATPTKTLIILNTIVHSLSWQPTVARLLKERPRALRCPLSLH